MHFVFDLDGTLYSFNDSPFDQAVLAKATAFVSRRLGLAPANALELVERYGQQYGHAGIGLNIHHHIAFSEYCEEAFHKIDVEKLLHRDERMVALLQTLSSAGHSLWVMTNGDSGHAMRALAALGIAEFFDGRVLTIERQWEASNAAYGARHNKPTIEAYRVAESMIGASGSDCVMVEDSMANLVAPRQLGWRTVWVSQGRPTPADSCADYVISSAKDMIGVVESMTASKSPDA